MELKVTFIVLLAVCCQAIGGNGAQPTPVPDFNPMLYVGNWYQVYANKLVLSYSQPGAACTTLQLGQLDGYTLSVDQRFRQSGPIGEVRRTTGQAEITATPGILAINYDNIPDTYNNYVIKVGPVSRQTRQYSYAVVTNDKGTALYVLARNVEDFLAGPKQEVLAFLTEQGFTTEDTEPVLIPHLPTCMYPRSYEPVVTLDSIDQDKYVGKYFMLYNNKNIDDRVSRGSKCATIQYTTINATAVTVENRFRIGAVDGPLDTSGTGEAVSTETGVYTVFFNKFPGIQFDYRPIKLGPVVNGQYDYTVVTDEAKFSIFVMVRDPEKFKVMYEREVLDFVSLQGFDSLTNSPLKQYHGPDCQYVQGFTYPGTFGAKEEL